MLASLFLSFAALLLLGLPIAYALLLSAALALYVAGIDLSIVPQRMFNSLDSFPLVAVPLFVFAGELLNKAGVSRRLIALAIALVGHFKGGLGHVNVVSSMLFAGISGSATADAAALGKVLIPAMQREKYDLDFAIAITAASATIGPIIPPSIIMVVYGSMTNLSIGQLFLAGVVPGFLMGASFLLLSYLYAIRRNYPSHSPASWRELRQAFRQAFFPLMAVAIVFGGIVGGVFTPTEAGAVAVAYTLLLSLAYDRISLRDLYETAFRCALLTSAILIILGAASSFSWVVARAQLPGLLGTAIVEISPNAAVQLLVIILFILVIGMFLEGMAAMIILIPVLSPMSLSMGMDPIHFATVVVVGIVIGTITPPMGLLLYVTCGVVEAPLRTVTRIIWVFVAAMVAVLLLTAYVPAITTFLPTLLAR